MRDVETDAYIEAKRIGMLRGNLVAALRDAEPITYSRWDDETGQYVVRETGVVPRSVMLLVAQYWNDNADDECHLMLIASPHETPFYPHVCGGDDACRDCGNVGRIDWGYTEIIPTVQPFAPEGGSQYTDDNVSFRPWAVARRGEPITVEVVHPPLRGWLDLRHERSATPALPARAMEVLGDRAVLADALIDAGDPRGELIAHARRGLDVEELVAQHGRSWLGAIEPYVPRAGVRYRDGVPDEIFVCYDGKEPLADSALPWRLRPRVHCLAQCQDFWVPEMRHARALGIVDEELLDRIAGPTELEHLEVLVHGYDFQFPREKFPKLHTLVLHGANHGVGIPRGVNVEVVALRCEDEAAHVEWLRRWVASNAPVICSMHDHDTWSARGWTVDLGGPTIVVSHRGFHPLATHARREALRRAFDRPYREVGSATWSPHG